MSFYREAITKLVPEGTIFETIFDENGWRIGRWGSPSVTKPTEKEIDAKVAELQAEYDANQYQSDRASAYPSWQEQMDLLYHGGVDALKAELKKTKDKFSKP
jgi:hypothetical protein